MATGTLPAAVERRTTPPPTYRQRVLWRLHIPLFRLREYLLHDAYTLRHVIGATACIAGFLLYWLGSRRKGFAILAKIHRAALSPPVSSSVESLVRSASRSFSRGRQHPLHQVYLEHVRGAAPDPRTARYFRNPELMLRGNVIVLKSPGAAEKGALLLYYSYTYQCFAKLFDLPAVARKYHIILEPSWSGLCDLNVLHFTRLGTPVFVGSVEPRDTAFINRLATNLIPVYFGNNTWVDHRVFFPIPAMKKDLDIVMVAGWGRYKRHWAFLSALRTLRKRGLHPKVALVGYPLGESLDTVRRQADLFGVGAQIEFYESLGPEEVNVLYNRAKVNVLWSRREGSPRSIIEGMFAGVPCVLREGFNFGSPYPHINPRTGRFSSEAALPDTLVDMIENHDRYSPRDWVMENLSCQRSTARLNAAIKATALARGEVWTRNLTVKTNDLNGLRYWNPQDGKTFAPDYDFLRSAVIG